MTAKDITDVAANFVADLFMIRDGSTWYMFFEVMNACTNQGDIGLATSPDGLNWTYKQIVLYEPFHLSYLYVFKYKHENYMIPESHHSNSILSYKALDFPIQWLFVGVLLEGQYTEPSIFYFNGKWWIFACTNPYKNDVLNLY